MLIRLFRGVVREGAHDRMIRALHEHVLPGLAAHPDVISSTLAVGLDDDPVEYLVETRWRGLPELVRFAGDDWKKPRIEPCEEELLVAVSAHHYLAEEAAASPAPMRAGATAAPVIHLGDIEIDGPRLQVVWNGSALHLPPREMAAMLALASDAGAPISSAELARQIWPGSGVVTPYDVRRVVHELRARLRRGGTPLLVHNVHGIGYGLEPSSPA